MFTKKNTRKREEAIYLNAIGAKAPTATLAAMALKLASVEAEFTYFNFSVTKSLTT
jgi:hypothetical protein